MAPSHCGLLAIPKLSMVSRARMYHTLQIACVCGYANVTNAFHVDFPCIPNQTVEICSVYLKVTPAFLLFPIHFYAYPSFGSALKKFLREFYCKLVFSDTYF